MHIQPRRTYKLSSFLSHSGASVLLRLGADAIIPVEQVLSYLPKVEFPQELYKKVSCGVSFNTDLSIDGPFTVYCSGEFFGVGVVEGGFFKIKTYLKD